VGLLANVAATVDVISGGRLELAVGAGWNEHEAAAYGMPLGTLTQRMDRLAEHLDALERLFVDPPVTVNGRYCQLTDATLSLRTVQRPHPPIVIGGVGPRRTIPIVARFAQHWNLALSTPEEVPARLALLAERCATLGRDPSTITTSVIVRVWPEQELDEVAKNCAAYQGIGIDLIILSLSNPALTPSVLEPLADRLIEAGVAG
jgi:alkanesulfonate monooxygenase SsuD/methylene tetrahydromethanopterin reductase-like flavin-dependent oxidoreductase (luciferase family)